MEPVPRIDCRYCRHSVEDGYYCSNCGRQLRTPPPSSSFLSQLHVYLVSIFLPPFGLWYVYTYLSQSDRKLKLIGLVALILTLVSVYFSYTLLRATVDGVDKQLQMLNSLSY